MAARKPKQQIQAVSTHEGFRLVRPGARYAVCRKGDARPGAWLREDEALPMGWVDAFPEEEARSLLPFLRARGKAGRRGAAPTTADGRLVARACARLGLTAAALAERIGVHETMLSKARNGTLVKKHREAIKALLKEEQRKVVG